MQFPHENRRQQKRRCANTLIVCECVRVFATNHLNMRVACVIFIFWNEYFFFFTKKPSYKLFGIMFALQTVGHLSSSWKVTNFRGSCWVQHNGIYIIHTKKYKCPFKHQLKRYLLAITRNTLDNRIDALQNKSKRIRFA